jgi:hypothetical protein
MSPGPSDALPAEPASSELSLPDLASGALP